MQIVPYQPSDFDRTVTFLRGNWAADHPVYDRPLFDWQYQGGAASLLVVDDGAVVGFLGNIPARFSLDGTDHAAAGLTMWCVARELRSGGLGVRLIRATEKANPVTFTLGAGTGVLPMYRSMGYSVLPHLHRFVVPLIDEGFQRLLPEPAADVVARRWPIGATGSPDPTTLAALFDRTVRPAFRLTKVRDADFWMHRYVENVGFTYHRFGGPATGAVVVRVETVDAPGRPDVDGASVLRLIELLPATAAAWAGEPDAAFTRLLGGVLGWAAARGCVAADFQCASARAAHLLAPLGFLDRHWPVAELLRPFRPATAPINFVWRTPVPVDADDCYVVKSDCDMDRPTTWPAAAPVAAQPRRIAC